MKYLLLTVIGFSFGLFVSAGAFTVLLAAGMITRFAGKLAIAKYNLLLEEFVILGVLWADFWDILLCIKRRDARTPILVSQCLELAKKLPHTVQLALLAMQGLFIGIFVGCLAMTIAELLDAIPIFARRTGMKKGLEWATAFLAIGKLVGSLVYFGFQ